jgi:tetratricopeptide (TPR) repeat protein
VFDVLLGLVQRRISSYLGADEGDLILGEAAAREAADLWQAAQGDDVRLAAARRVLGDLYCLRYLALPQGPDHLELARLVVLLWTNAYVPEPLRVVIGGAADPHVQAAEGARLLNDAMAKSDPLFLEAATLLLTAAVSGLDDGHPHMVVSLNNLCAAHQHRHLRFGDPAALDRSIAAGERGLAVAADGDPNRTLCLSNLGAAYWYRFTESADAADLRRAVERGEQAVAASGEHDPARASHLTNLSRALIDTDLDRAIEVGGQAVAAARDDLSALGARNILGGAHEARYQRSGSPDDLSKAVDLAETVVACAPADWPARASALSNLGGVYQKWLKHEDTVDTAGRVVDVLEQAVAACPHGHPERPGILAALAVAHHDRFRHTTAVSEMDSAISCGEQCLALLAHDHVRRGEYLADLAGFHFLRFACAGAPADLDRSIDLLEQAVAATPAGEERRAAYQTDLSSVYGRRFDRGRNTADLDRMVELSQQALASRSEADSDWPFFMTGVGIAYRKRAQATGSGTDLDQAVDCGTRALAAAPSGHRHHADCLAGLANAYRARYEARGGAADLDQAIHCGEQCLALALDVELLDRPIMTANLGAAYRKRFELSGVTADLDRAIELGEAAVAEAGDGRPTWDSHLADLSGAYVMRSVRHGSGSDLENAIRLQSLAVDAVAGNHPTLAGYLADLALLHRLRHRRTGNDADLDAAIGLGEEAVAACAAGHPDEARCLTNLGEAYTTRFQDHRQTAHLDRAMELCARAVSATPDDHPSRAHHLYNLVNVHRAAADGISRSALAGLVRQVTGATTSSPVVRIRAADALASLAYDAHEHATAVRLWDLAVELLPSVPPRESGWSDQEHRLGSHSGLVGKAFAAHCAIDDPAGAVEVAELGRGILLGAALNTRTDLTDLDRARPDLAAGFRRVRSGLDADAGTDQRKRLWSEHDELLARIRREPGFDRFLRPPRLTDLRQAVTGGAAVLVADGEHGGHAVVVTADTEPVLVPLPELTTTAAIHHAAAMLDATHSSGLTATLSAQRVLPEVLGWLWDAVTEPVLGAVAQARPRIWWLPLGVLGLFPLHAAGRPGAPGALDLAVSSYTSTLRTLAHTRARPAAAARRQLVVALAHTPGLPDLPGTVAEAMGLRVGTAPLLDSAATTDSVTAALFEHTWVHFACHASTDVTSPSRSGLCLYDGSLPLSEIGKLRLDDAELAYLSACSTAHRGIRHADESLHLASAFQLAGFRHVIASLWPLADRVAAVAAHDFYRLLPGTPTADQAATALRDVTCGLRDRYPGRPELWAALVHTGP